MPRLPRPFPAIPPKCDARVSLINASLDRHEPQTEPEACLALVRPEVLVEGQLPPWMAQPGETAQEYEAFRLWLDTQTEAPRTQLAKRMGWTNRKVAFDVCLGPTSLGSPEARADNSRRALQMVKRLAMVELSKLLAAAETSPQPSMTLREISLALGRAIQLERLLDGQSTENVSVRTGAEQTDDPYQGLTEDEFAIVAGIEMQRRARMMQG